MSRQVINLGVAITGEGGDTPRSAMIKVNTMTQEIYAGIPISGRAMPEGAGGWLGPSLIGGNNNSALATGLWGFNGSPVMPYTIVQMLSSDWGPDPRNQCQLIMGVATSRLWYRTISKDQTAYSPVVEFYSTGNTTRAQDGTLKAI
ncbi:hypothetical protein [Pseudomonas fluorescens]|uniref:hypothetical protein n=1 Tax=Pseudomonas fluorescens TaxID=294 RepID=UPI001BE96935|nr:hypothetical protein [Pseudomonas fluorescens]MBT2374856.1 hypothetical protein [Pseudomonas fluorescens]